jgi:hypothetical protein
MELNYHQCETAAPNYHQCETAAPGAGIAKVGRLPVHGHLNKK